MKETKVCKGLADLRATEVGEAVATAKTVGDGLSGSFGFGGLPCGDGSLLLSFSRRADASGWTWVPPVLILQRLELALGQLAHLAVRSLAR